MSKANDCANETIATLRAQIVRLEQQLEERTNAAASIRDAQRKAERAISVLRSTEHRFRALFDSNVIGIVEINRERVLDANESFLQMMGYSREAVLDGKLLLREITPPKYHRMDDAAHAAALERGSFPPFEKELIRKDGSVVPVWVGSVLLDKPPDWSCITFVLDLTERKMLEEQFYTAQKLKSLGLLSGIIAHDFNNLLTTMMCNATFCLDSLALNHPAYAPIEEILRASQLASGLTNQLVGYSSKPRHRSNAINLSRLVREIGDLIELPLSAKVEIEWNLAPQLPPILGDAYLVQQIVMNLVINAADAIERPGGTVRIVTHCRDFTIAELEAMTSGSSILTAGTYVAVEIHDTGCGMTDAVKARIFDPLFTTKEKGRGLGLASALNIVRSHGGVMDVRSQLGIGTTFVILFPATVESPQIARESPVGDLAGHGIVLVVDDEPSVRRLAEATLSRYGYQVLLAANGREAIEIYSKQRNSISLILMDLSMPVMSGDEAAEELLALKPSPPLLFSSGFSERESMVRAEGFPFLRKPYTSRQLAEQVKMMHAVNGK